MILKIYKLTITAELQNRPLASGVNEGITLSLNERPLPSNKKAKTFFCFLFFFVFFKFFFACEVCNFAKSCPPGKRVTLQTYFKGSPEQV